MELRCKTCGAAGDEYIGLNGESEVYCWQHVPMGHCKECGLETLVDVNGVCAVCRLLEIAALRAEE